MAGQTWSIMIVPATSGGGAAFFPDVVNAKEGDHLKTQNLDLVSWNNKTDNPHHPWLADKDFKPVFTTGQLNLSECIAPWDSSTPAYLIPAAPTVPTDQTIYYVCLNHPNEQGVIEVFP